MILDKDANINVTALAAKCLTCLANGLRIKFAIFVRDIVPVIFEKFKEKKPLLRDNLIECIDAVYATTVFFNKKNNVYKFFLRILKRLLKIL